MPLASHSSTLIYTLASDSSRLVRYATDVDGRRYDCNDATKDRTDCTTNNDDSSIQTNKHTDLHSNTT